MGVYFYDNYLPRQSLNKADSVSIEGQIEICKKELPATKNIIIL